MREHPQFSETLYRSVAPVTARHAGPDHRATPDETPPQPVFIAMDMHFTPAAAHPLPPDCPAPPPHGWGHLPHPCPRRADTKTSTIAQHIARTRGGHTLGGKSHAAWWWCGWGDAQRPARDPGNHPR